MRRIIICNLLIVKMFKGVLEKDRRLFLQLGIAFLMMTLARLAFFWINKAYFPTAGFSEVLAGMWVDVITIGLAFIPFYFFSLLPFSFTARKRYQIFLAVLFHGTNVFLIGVNLIDAEYFKYTAKRSTADLFAMMQIGNDTTDMMGAFFLDFWWLFGLFFLMTGLSIRLYRQTIIQQSAKRTSRWGDAANFVLMMFLLLVISRGGFRYRPANALIAAQLTSTQNAALVLNTPFTILKTFGKPALTKKKFFPKDSPDLYIPVHEGSTDHRLGESPNVMIIILESFGNEWLGQYSGGNFTPFLDSLLDHSLYFVNGFSNGKKSIEAVPAIFAGIPALMSNPYITSGYASNKISSLPALLKSRGYSTAFYHGATNGSMNFDTFASHLGFEAYYGKSEYPNSSHSDATWGILDEYFLPWTARAVTEDLKEPFLAGLFTLSSHHPYFVPELYRKTLPAGDHPLAQSIAYADLSLKLFFQEARKQPWFRNTLFVLTADHTPVPDDPGFSFRTRTHRIPIALYDPSGQLPARKEEKIFSQIDILPTVLDLTGYPEDTYSFGNSWFSERPPFSVNFLNGAYAYFQENFMLQWIQDRNSCLYDFQNDPLMERDLSGLFPEVKLRMEKNLKGFVQRFNNDLIQNRTVLR